MKTMFVAAAASLLVLGGAANAKSVGTAIHASVASDSLQRENPTGLPAYKMRSNGLMINGLLPANGWQG